MGNFEISNVLVTVFLVFLFLTVLLALVFVFIAVRKSRKTEYVPCPRCGVGNIKGVPYCHKCGAKIPSK